MDFIVDTAKLRNSEPYFYRSRSSSVHTHTAFTAVPPLPSDSPTLPCNQEGKSFLSRDPNGAMGSDTRFLGVSTTSLSRSGLHPSPDGQLPAGLHLFDLWRRRMGPPPQAARHDAVSHSIPEVAHLSESSLGSSTSECRPESLAERAVIQVEFPSDIPCVTHRIRPESRNLTRFNTQRPSSRRTIVVTETAANLCIYTEPTRIESTGTPQRLMSEEAANAQRWVSVGRQKAVFLEVEDSVVNPPELRSTGSGFLYAKELGCVSHALQDGLIRPMTPIVGERHDQILFQSEENSVLHSERVVDAEDMMPREQPVVVGQREGHALHASGTNLYSRELVARALCAEDPHNRVFVGHREDNLLYNTMESSLLPDSPPHMTARVATTCEMLEDDVCMTSLTQSRRHTGLLEVVNTHRDEDLPIGSTTTDGIPPGAVSAALSVTGTISDAPVATHVDVDEEWWLGTQSLVEPLAQSTTLLENNIPLLVTEHSRIFPGRGWPVILRWYVNRVHEAVLLDTSQACGIPTDAISQVNITATPQGDGLQTSFTIAHPTEATSAHDLQMLVMGGNYSRLHSLYVEAEPVEDSLLGDRPPTSPTSEKQTSWSEPSVLESSALVVKPLEDSLLGDRLTTSFMSAKQTTWSEPSVLESSALVVKPVEHSLLGDRLTTSFMSAKQTTLSEPSVLESSALVVKPVEDSLLGDRLTTSFMSAKQTSWSEPSALEPSTFVIEPVEDSLLGDRPPTSPTSEKQTTWPHPSALGDSILGDSFETSSQSTASAELNVASLGDLVCYHDEETSNEEVHYYNSDGTSIVQVSSRATTEQLIIPCKPRVDVGRSVSLLRPGEDPPSLSVMSEPGPHESVAFLSAPTQLVHVRRRSTHSVLLCNSSHHSESTVLSISNFTCEETRISQRTPKLRQPDDNPLRQSSIQSQESGDENSFKHVPVAVPTGQLICFDEEDGTWSPRSKRKIMDESIREATLDSQLLPLEASYWNNLADRARWRFPDAVTAGGEAFPPNRVVPSGRDMEKAPEKLATQFESAAFADFLEQLPSNDLEVYFRSFPGRRWHPILRMRPEALRAAFVEDVCDCTGLQPHQVCRLAMCNGSLQCLWHVAHDEQSRHLTNEQLRGIFDSYSFPKIHALLFRTVANYGSPKADLPGSPDRRLAVARPTSDASSKHHSGPLGHSTDLILFSQSVAERSGSGRLTGMPVTRSYSRSGELGSVFVAHGASTPVRPELGSTPPILLEPLPIKQVVLESNSLPGGSRSYLHGQPSVNETSSFAQPPESLLVQKPTLLVVSEKSLQEEYSMTVSDAVTQPRERPLQSLFSASHPPEQLRMMAEEDVAAVSPVTPPRREESTSPPIRVKSAMQPTTYAELSQQPRVKRYPSESLLGNCTPTPITVLQSSLNKKDLIDPASRRSPSINIEQSSTLCGGSLRRTPVLPEIRMIDTQAPIPTNSKSVQVVTVGYKESSRGQFDTENYSHSGRFRRVSFHSENVRKLEAFSNRADEPIFYNRERSISESPCEHNAAPSDSLILLSQNNTPEVPAGKDTREPKIDGRTSHSLYGQNRGSELLVEFNRQARMSGVSPLEPMVDRVLAESLNGQSEYGIVEVFGTTALGMTDRSTCTENEPRRPTIHEGDLRSLYGRPGAMSPMHTLVQNTVHDMNAPETAQTRIAELASQYLHGGHRPSGAILRDECHTIKAIDKESPRPTVVDDDLGHSLGHRPHGHSIREDPFASPAAPCETAVLLESIHSQPAVRTPGDVRLFVGCIKSITCNESQLHTILEADRDATPVHHLDDHRPESSFRQILSAGFAGLRPVQNPYRDALLGMKDLTAHARAVNQELATVVCYPCNAHRNGYTTIVQLYRHYCRCYRVPPNSSVVKTWRFLHDPIAAAAVPSEQQLLDPVGLSAVRYVSLPDLALKDAGWLPVLEVLRWCPNIFVLDVSGNELTNEAVEWLSEATGWCKHVSYRRVSNAELMEAALSMPGPSAAAGSIRSDSARRGAEALVNLRHRAPELERIYGSPFASLSGLEMNSNYLSMGALQLFRSIIKRQKKMRRLGAKGMTLLPIHGALPTVPRQVMI